MAWTATKRAEDPVAKPAPHDTRTEDNNELAIGDEGLKVWESLAENGEIVTDIDKLHDPDVRNEFMNATDVPELGPFARGFYIDGRSEEPTRRTRCLDGVRVSSFLIDKVLTEVPEYWLRSQAELVEFLDGALEDAFRHRSLALHLLRNPVPDIDGADELA